MVQRIISLHCKFFYTLLFYYHLILFIYIIIENSQQDNMTIFENICSSLPGAPFSWFFREALCVHRTDTDFSGRFVCFSNRCHFLERYVCSNRQFSRNRQFLCLPIRFRFYRSTFLVTKQITIFQEVFFEYHLSDRQFPGRFSSSNRYFNNRSWWLFLYYVIINYFSISFNSSPFRGVAL